MINENDTYVSNDIVYKVNNLLNSGSIHRTTGIVEKMTWSLAAVLVIVYVLCAYFAP